MGKVSKFAFCLATMALTGCAAPGMAPMGDRPIPMPVQARMVSSLSSTDEIAWNLAQIHKDGFRVQAQTSKPVVVAVLDTGVDPQQPDLRGMIYPIIDQVGSDRFLNNGRLIDYTGRDGNGHGTHVSGIVAQVANGSPVRILPVKVIPNDGVGDDHLLSDGIEQAIAWRDANDPSVRVRVMNLSVSSPLQSDRLKRAIRHATDEGILVVGAAGNDAKAVEFPSNMPEVLSVGATTVDDQPASYSCFGDALDMVAPGGSDDTPVYSSWPTYLTSSDYDDGVNLPHTIAGLVGTSMAAPHVAGAAAVLWTLHPNATAQQIRGELLGMSDDLGATGPDVNDGYGRLNLQHAYLGDQHDAH